MTTGTMTRRDYLITLGLAKPTRGRLGREALIAIERAEAAGVEFVQTPAERDHARAVQRKAERDAEAARVSMAAAAEAARTREAEERAAAAARAAEQQRARKLKAARTAQTDRLSLLATPRQRKVPARPPTSGRPLSGRVNAAPAGPLRHPNVIASVAVYGLIDKAEYERATCPRAKQNGTCEVVDLLHTVARSIVHERQKMEYERQTLGRLAPI